MGGGGADSLPMCVRYPILRNFRIGALIGAFLYALMMIPAASLAIYPDSVCENSFSDLFLVIYAALCVVVFSWFAWDLRDVMDSYHLKTEFKLVGIGSASMIFIWFSFIKIPALRKLEFEYVRFSVLSVFVAQIITFVATIVRYFVLMWFILVV